MLDLETLLPLWAQVEPGRVRRFAGDDQRVILNPNLWHVCPSHGLPLVDTQHPTWIDYAAVEQAVRDAIKAQGWSWGKAFNPEAAVVSPDDTGKTLYCESVGESGLAIALLSAYLKARGIEIGGG